MIAQGKKIILFDGVCNLCNTWVQRIIEKDANDIFRFASLQSDIAKQLMNERHLQQTSVDSIVLIVPGVAYFVKSDAALEIAKEMGGKYRLLQMILSVFPVSLRDPEVMTLLQKIDINGMGKWIAVWCLPLKS